MNFPWMLFVDLGVISIALLLATLIRARVAFFQRYLIPNALTAGFLLLPFYNFVAPFVGMSSDGLGALVYHLLGISFVAMSLRRPEATKKKGDLAILSTSILSISQFAIQGLVGLSLTFLFIKTLFPDLFPSFGFFLPLGFALGPGQAYAIGEGWVKMGFNGAPSIGLTFAAIGFLWACFGGIFLINYGIRKGWLTRDHKAIIQSAGGGAGVYPRGRDLPPGSHLTTETEAIDSMSLNMAVVLMSYLFGYLLLKLLTFLLSFAGNLGNELAVNLWGISFIFAAVMALGVRRLFELLNVDFIIDNGTLTRISGNSVDLMVSGSLGAISLVIVMQWWFPILATCILGGLIVFLVIPWICSRIFTDYYFHRTLIIYGAATGTMPTGLALLRVIDPDFKTPVATDYMYASALTFVLVIPLILAINLPAYSYTTGKPIYFWLAFAVLAAYLLSVFVALKKIAGDRAFKKPGSIWLGEA